VSIVSKRRELRLRRKKRIRDKVTGTAIRPRLSFFKSSKHVYAQIIDDEKGCTLASVSSFEKGNHMRASVKVCEELGKLMAERCKKQSIEKIVFDKNGNKYHGRVKAFADAARLGGLSF